VRMAEKYRFIEKPPGSLSSFALPGIGQRHCPNS
jgi:hypothetical protein